MSFEGIRGQEFAVGLLRRAVRSSRLASGYLFFGPDGVGKRTTALAFARAVLCPHGAESGDACGACPSCRRSAAESHPGLVLVSRLPGKTLLGIDQMHELSERLSLRPTEGDRTVSVLDEMERTSLPAFNALLKTLEEPPPGATIVLVTANREALPETIRSRCQAVRFRPLPEADLAGILSGPCELPEDEAGSLAGLAGGSVSRAVRLREMGMLTSRRMLDEILEEGGDDPVEASAGLVKLLGGGDLAEVRLRAREIVLLLIERVRAEILHRRGDSEGARFCFKALARAVDNLRLNVDPRAVLRAAVVEVLPRWKKTRPI